MEREQKSGSRVNLANSQRQGGKKTINRQLLVLFAFFIDCTLPFLLKSLNIFIL
jgi:hypothetical protein